MKKILLMVIIFVLLGAACASVSIRLEDTSVLLSMDGNEIIPPGTYKNIVSIATELFAAGDKTYALMDDAGNLLTDFLYGDLQPAGEVLLACRDGAWGLLGRDGRERSQFAYSRIVSDGTAFWALQGSLSDRDSDALFLLDSNGRETETGLLVRRMDDTAADGRIAVQLQDGLHWGYCDAKGELIIPAVFSHASAFRGGCAVVVQDGKFGAIDMQGSLIVPAQYDALEISPCGLILAMQNGVGAQIFSPEGTEIAAYPGEELYAALVGEGYAVVAGEEMHLYDASGALLDTASHQAAVYEGFVGGFIIADGAWGEECVRLTGAEGAWQNLYPLGMAGDTPLYASMRVNTAQYMNDQLGEIQLAVDMDSARYGVVDAAGTERIGAEYESIEYIGEDRLLLYVEGLWQVSDSDGRIYWSYGVRQSEEPSF